MSIEEMRVDLADVDYRWSKSSNGNANSFTDTQVNVVVSCNSKRINVPCLKCGSKHYITASCPQKCPKCSIRHGECASGKSQGKLKY